MREPSLRTSRLAIAGALVALIAAGGGGFLLGRAVAPAPEPVQAPSPQPAPSAPVPAPAKVLGRGDLIALGAAGADAIAGGRTLPTTATAMAGRRFELDLPFGCDGPAAEGSAAAMRWRYDDAADALRVHVAPMVWQATDWWAEPPRAIEAMQGFWIERPWSSSERCPGASSLSAAPGAEPVTLPGQTLGVVQLITQDTPRQVRRDGKPYQAVVKLAPSAIPASGGLLLRLTGRLGQFPDGQPVRCRQEGGREQRPVCLIAVTLEEVGIRNPATGETLAVWQPTTSDARTEGRARE